MVGKKSLYIAFGIIATVIAVLGVVLPGVPTVLPLIVALWAFGKSSPTLHSWVSKLPLFKYALVEVERFERDRSVDLRVKLISAVGSWVSVAGVALVTKNLTLTILVAISAMACTLFMLYVPTRRVASGQVDTD